MILVKPLHFLRLQQAQNVIRLNGGTIFTKNSIQNTQKNII